MRGYLKCWRCSLCDLFASNLSLAVLFRHLHGLAVPNTLSKLFIPNTSLFQTKSYNACRMVSRPEFSKCTISKHFHQSHYIVFSAAYSDFGLLLQPIFSFSFFVFHLFRSKAFWNVYHNDHSSPSLSVPCPLRRPLPKLSICPMQNAGCTGFSENIRI